MKVIPLGTGGFIPNAVRETASVLVIEDDIAVLFDAGTGVRRLLDPVIQSALKDVTTLKVVFSHFHLDHTCGVPWLLRLWQRALEFYVPTAPVVESDGLRSLETLTNAPFFALSIRDWTQVRGVFELRDGVKVGAHALRTLKQEHSGGSVGFRLGDFAYITDFAPTAGHIEFLRGADLVVMDTMYDAKARTGNAAGGAQHGDSISNATIALDAGVGRLGLIHIDPFFGTDAIETLMGETRSIFGDAFLPEEGEQYTVRS